MRSRSIAAIALLTALACAGPAEPPPSLALSETATAPAPATGDAAAPEGASAPELAAGKPPADDPRCRPHTLTLETTAESTPGDAAPDATFTGLGSKDPVPFALEGTIYFLEPHTSALPDLSTLEPQGTVYATALDVPERKFEEGFPGVTDRNEWFAIEYTGTLVIPTAGTWTFEVSSDDGSKLWIDEVLVVDNDGVHPTWSREGTIDLTPGPHAVRVQYFQGPRWYIALQVRWTPPGGEPATLRSDAHSDALITAAGTRVTLDAEVLFDFDGDTLRPEATPVLTGLKQTAIDPFPGRQVVIEGHTDDVGGNRYNLGLSRRRARAVVAWLEAAGVDGARLEPIGYGERWPRCPNDTPEHRQLNRRVEVVVRAR